MRISKERDDSMNRPIKIGEWIPMKERWPEEDQYVLVTVQLPDYPFKEPPHVDTCRFNSNNPEHRELITAWMPSPEPYKEEE